jgi:ABC-type Fe3+ transport system permease subunit
MVAVAERSVHARGEALRRLLSARNLIVRVVAFVIAYLALVPVGCLIWQTFVRGGHYTVSAFRDAYATVGIGTMLLNSFIFSFGSTIFALVVGTALAYLLVRTDVPGKALMYAASVVPLIIPGILHSISWTFLLDPHNGIANTFFIQKLGFHAFNVYSLPGMIFIEGVHLAPLVFPGLVLGVAMLDVYLRLKWLPVYGTLWILFIAYLTRYMPYGMRYAVTSMFQIGKELEESAQMSGAGWFQAFRRIVLPLLVPGFVAGWIYIFVVSFRELGSSVLLYSPGKEVLSIAIWQQWQDGLLPQLSALGVMLVGFLVVMVAIAYKLGARIGVRET